MPSDSIVSGRVVTVIRCFGYVTAFCCAGRGSLRSFRHVAGNNYPTRAPCARLIYESPALDLLCATFTKAKFLKLSPQNLYYVMLYPVCIHAHTVLFVSRLRLALPPPASIVHTLNRKSRQQQPCVNARQDGNRAAVSPMLSTKSIAAEALNARYRKRRAMNNNSTEFLQVWPFRD
jgi:hypothetical protein